MTAYLAQLAVQQALTGHWQAAIATNLHILADAPDDTEALNRLARAYAETGNMKKAISTARTVLKLDEFNSIAKKSLARWQDGKKDFASGATSVTPGFLEEPGKTKTVNLIHLGASELVASLNSGDEVKLGASGHRICILTLTEGKFIGRLSDDLSARLKQLMGKGNKYKVFVKSVTYDEAHRPTQVCVFIKETQKAHGLASVQSFVGDKVDLNFPTSPSR